MISEVIISKLLNNYKDQKNESSFIDAQSVHWDYFKETCFII